MIESPTVIPPALVEEPLDDRVACVAMQLGHRPAAAAACHYLLRRERMDHPVGWFDTGGRRYPDDSEGLIWRHFRMPTRTYPYSYLLACRSAAHCARLHGCEDVTLVRRIARLIEKSPSLEAGVAEVRSALAEAKRRRRAATRDTHMQAA